MMRNDIQPSLETISKYFDRREFYIPSYQRPYSWEVSQCEQLIEDIENHKENFDEASRDNYFFGAILIAHDSEENHEITLIDGQQRTTTFMLLLKALLMKVSEELKKLSKDNDEDERLIDKLKSLKNDIIKMLYNLNDDNLFYYKKNEYKLKEEDTKYTNESVSELYSRDMYAILINEDLETIKKSVIKIFRRQKDNKYSNFYKNFRYFYRYCKELTNTQVRDLADHIINRCQVITITSFNTDQAINIFNSLNGTGVPLTPIEVIVSKATANAKDRKVFEHNWQEIVKKTDKSSLNLNLLITHYIFVKLSEQHNGVTRNPGIRAFFAKNNKLFNNDKVFTSDLEKILENMDDINDTGIGQILNKFNGNIKPFISSFLFFRKDNEYLEYLLRLGTLLEITDFAYGNYRFKGFLEKINLKYSQVDSVSNEQLVEEIKKHIENNFNRDIIEEELKKSGVSAPIIYLNEYLYSKEKKQEFDLSGNVDIEHIMPRSGLNRENIMKDSGCIDDDEFNEYAEKLGNKIILESDINRGIGDSWFRTKKENSITKHSGYIGSKYSIAKALSRYPKDTWDKWDIDKATSKAARRITDFIFV